MVFNSSDLPQPSSRTAFQLPSGAFASVERQTAGSCWAEAPMTRGDKAVGSVSSSEATARGCTCSRSRRTPAGTQPVISPVHPANVKKKIKISQHCGMHMLKSRNHMNQKTWNIFRRCEKENAPDPRWRPGEKGQGCIRAGSCPGGRKIAWDQLWSFESALSSFREIERPRNLVLLLPSPKSSSCSRLSKN